MDGLKPSDDGLTCIEGVKYGIVIGASLGGVGGVIVIVIIACIIIFFILSKLRIKKRKQLFQKHQQAHDDFPARQQW